MRKLKLFHWFGIWLVFMLLFAVATQPAERPDKLSQEGFGTTESAEIYFNNVRSFYYNLTEEGGGMFRVYRLKSAAGITDGCGVYLSIYHSWRLNEAYIRLDTNLQSTPGEPVLFITSIDSRSDTLEHPGPYNESHLGFAVRLYRLLQGETEVALLHPDGTVCALTGAERRHLRRTLTDYFKLVGRL